MKTKLPVPKPESVAVVDALRESSDLLLDPARRLLRDLDRAGKSVALNPTSDGLVAYPMSAREAVQAALGKLAAAKTTVGSSQ